MMKKSFKSFIFLILSFAMMATVLASCGANSSSDNAGDSDTPKKSDGKPLVVGVQSSVISVPMVYANEQGYFKDLGLNVELVIFPNGAPENEGLAAEQLDVASNGLASVFSLASGLCTWVGETDTTEGSTFLFARPDNPVFDSQGEIEKHPNMYGDSESLKNQKILGPTSTIQQHMASAYMSQFGLKAGTDYEFLNMDNSAATQAFLAGEGDMIVCSDQSFVDIVEEAGMKKVASYEDATEGILLNGILVRNDVLKDRKGDVELLLKGMYKASDELMADSEKRFEFTYKFFNDNGKNSSEQSVRDEIALRDFVTEEYMKRDDYILGNAMVGTGEFFASIGTIEESQVENIVNAIDPTLIKDLYQIEVKVPK